MDDDTQSERRVAEAVERAGRFAETVPVTLAAEQLLGREAHRHRLFGLVASSWWLSRRAFVVAPVAALAVATILVVSLLAFAGGRTHSTGSTHGNEVGPCTSNVVADELVGNGAVTASYLPPGFHLKSGNPADVGLGQSSSPLNYVSANPWQHLSISTNAASQPLGQQLIEQSNFRYRKFPVVINGHAGVLLTSSRNNPTVEVDWLVTADTSLSVDGYLLTSARLEEVARGVTFHPPTVVTLPLTPGRIVSEAEAARTASAMGHVVAAKLSSFFEVGTLAEFGNPQREVSNLSPPPAISIQVDQDGRPIVEAPGAPSVLINEPWRPIWAIMLQSKNVVLVDAASGQRLWSFDGGPNTAWFSAVTNRQPGRPDCLGGSTARIPFGVLTLAELEHRSAGRLRPAVPDATTTTYYKLAALPALNNQDTGQGCLQYCDLGTVEWITMTVTVAKPGTKIACPIPEGPGRGPGRGGRSGPPKTTAYSQFSYGNGGGINCGLPQPWYTNLKNLAPAAT
jgi:hypothetical protein